MEATDMGVTMDKRLVRVVWVDASDPSGNASWYTDKEVDDFSNKECEVVSVGWVKSETKLYLTLVADYIIEPDGTVTWGRPTKIPHGMVTSITDIGQTAQPQPESTSPPGDIG
jgi:hypothetical protein